MTDPSRSREPDPPNGPFRLTSHREARRGAPAIFRAGVLGIGALLALGAPSSARAQANPPPVDPSAQLPAGHPPIEPTGVDGVARAAGEGPLPAGHPGTAGSTKEPPRDRVTPAADLRPGTIEVYVHDGSEAPIAGAPVKLGILKQDIGAGDTRSERVATTDARGVASFDGLEIGTAYTYRITVNRNPATFASEPVHLSETGGQRVLLHVYPSTRDVREALIGTRGVIFVEPREDVFQIETNFQILNIGNTAWVPEHVTLKLPDGAKAFRAGDTMSDTRFDRSGDGPVELLGTFAPGQHELGFRFQLDNRHEGHRSFRMTLPPHVAELRLVAEGNRELVFTAGGFPDAEPTRGEDGSRLLVTGRHLTRGESPLDSVEITLDNLPVPSAGRWYAVLLAAVLAAFGLWKSLARRGVDERIAGGAGELAAAEERVLDELVALERLKRDQAVGPKTYLETRAALLDALGRLHGRTTSPT